MTMRPTPSTWGQNATAKPTNSKAQTGFPLFNFKKFQDPKNVFQQYKYKDKQQLLMLYTSQGIIHGETAIKKWKRKQ